jgi:hypothetical protein
MGRPFLAASFATAASTAFIYSLSDHIMGREYGWVLGTCVLAFSLLPLQMTNYALVTSRQNNSNQAVIADHLIDNRKFILAGLTVFLAAFETAVLTGNRAADILSGMQKTNTSSVASIPYSDSWHFEATWVDIVPKILALILFIWSCIAIHSFGVIFYGLWKQRIESITRVSLRDFFSLSSCQGHIPCTQSCCKHCAAKNIKNAGKALSVLCAVALQGIGGSRPCVDFMFRNFSRGEEPFWVMISLIIGFALTLFPILTDHMYQNNQPQASIEVIEPDEENRLEP